MFDFIKRILSRYGFGRRTVQVGFLPGFDNWQDAQFFTEHQRKTERLAAIAAEIAALNVKRLKAKEQKKNQTVFEDQMKALMNERLRIEGGK